MSLKQELEQWNAGCQAFENGDFEVAIELFEPIADSSKIHFNIGMSLLNIGQDEDAIAAFSDAVNRDNYFAVGFFQKGAAHYHIADYEAALDCFHEALENLRGNHFIDYSQLGLEFNLYLCEILHNKALSLYQLGSLEGALRELREAIKYIKMPKHGKIESALKEKCKYSQIFEVPGNTIYKPPASKIQSVPRVDYLGKSKVIAVLNEEDNYTEFRGSRKNVQEKNIKKSRHHEIRELGISADKNNSRGSSKAVGVRDACDTGYKQEERLKKNREEFKRRQITNYSAKSEMDSRNHSNFDEHLEYGSKKNVNDDPRFDILATSQEDHHLNYRESIAPSIQSSSSRAGSIRDGLLRIKTHYGNEKKVIVLPLDAKLNELISKIREKLRIQCFEIRFRDEDGEILHMKDDDDLLVARSASMDENRIEIWLNI